MNVDVANFLLLWAFLDRKDVWYGLFAAACSASAIASSSLSAWIGGIASDELEFIKAVRLLRNYSLIDAVKDPGSYATHPVVHRWAYYFQGEGSRLKLAQLAVIVVGLAVPNSSSRGYTAMQRRLLPHAQACSRWVEIDETGPGSPADKGGSIENQEGEERMILHEAIFLLGNLYADQGKLVEAEQMYQRALQGKEKAWGPEHTSTLHTVHNLGALYANQGKLAEAEQMYQRALQGYEKALGPEHTSTLDTVNNLGAFYNDQGKLVEAEQMYQRALAGYKKALGADNVTTYILALNTIWNLGSLLEDKDDFANARVMYSKALVGFDKVVRPNHLSSRSLRDRLHVLDERMDNKALPGIESHEQSSEGPSHLSAKGNSQQSKRNRLLKNIKFRFR